MCGKNAEVAALESAGLIEPAAPTNDIGRRSDTRTLCCHHRHAIFSTHSLHVDQCRHHCATPLATSTPPLLPPLFPRSGVVPRSHNRCWLDGLAIAAKMKEYGVAFKGFDTADDVGGTWHPSSGMPTCHCTRRATRLHSKITRFQIRPERHRARAFNNTCVRLPSSAG